MTNQLTNQLSILITNAETKVEIETQLVTIETKMSTFSM